MTDVQEFEAGLAKIGIGVKTGENVSRETFSTLVAPPDGKPVPTFPGGRSNVSRETISKLMTYQALLVKWNKAINLVAKSTVSEAFTRHFLDSAQLFPLVPENTTRLYDFGSGGGFPGLILAIMLEERGVDVHLMESDQRKCTFLREVARQTDTKVTVHNARIETIDLPPADVITARAFAPMEKLCGFAHRFWKNDTVGLFLKGEMVEQELTEAQNQWTLKTSLAPSQTASSGHILTLTDLAPRKID